MKNQIGIVKSTALLRWTVEKERLVDDPEFGSSSAPFEPLFPCANGHEALSKGTRIEQRLR
jgi:hypothetical protein